MVKNENSLNRFEMILLIVVLALTIGGVVISYVDRSYFEQTYVKEDGFIENFTVIPLAIGGVTSIMYLFKLSRYRSWLFNACMVFIAVFCFFIAGEEISWGQRIFNIETPEFFLENNLQQETNLHNLIVDGKKVNKIVFTTFLGAVVGLYLFVLPFVFRKNNQVRNFVNMAGIPIPRRKHLYAIIAFLALIAIIPSAKNAELLEMGISSIFLLILLFPENAYIYREKHYQTRL